MTPLLQELLAGFARFTQSRRLIRIETPLGDSTLMVHQLTGNEGLSSGFGYTVECLSDDVTLNLTPLIGKSATLKILQADNSERPINGIITEAQYTTSDGGFAFYTLKLESWFQVLQRTLSSRVFQDLSAVDIVEAIFKIHQGHGDLPVNYKLNLEKTYDSRSYCCQYRESDFAFIQRILAEEGIHWHIAHEQGKHTLILADNNDAFHADTSHEQGPALSAQYALLNNMLSEIQTRPGIRFHRAGATEATDGITEFISQRSLQPHGYQIMSWDYKTQSSLIAELGNIHTQGDGAPKLQQTDHTGMYNWSNPAQGEHYLQVMREAIEAQQKTFTGKSHVRSLQAGVWFELLNHPVVDAKHDERSRQFIITRQSIKGLNNYPAELAPLLKKLKAHSTIDSAIDSAADSTPATPQASEGIWQTRFEAIRRNIPYRSALQDNTGQRLNHKPTARGAQTAIVTGPAGEETYTDALGRVKVQFHWDTEGSLNENASCWLRVAKQIGGDNFGSQYIPRIGHEVTVAFFEGDIDRPIVMRAVYNGANQPAWHSNGVLSGVKSKEFKGSGFSQLVKDDTANEERLSAQTTQYQTELNLGHIITQNDNERLARRGLGLELRSDAAGVLRAAKGLLLTSEKGSDTQALYTAPETASRQQQAAQLLQSLSDTAQKQRSAAHTQPQALSHLAKDITGGKSSSDSSGHEPAPRAPTVAIHASADTHLASASHLHQVAGGHIHHSAEQSINLATTDQLNVAAMKHASLFALNDIRLDTGKGSTAIQAQANTLDALSAGEFKVLSDASIQIGASSTLQLITHEGAYVRIGNNIEIGAPGAIKFYSSQNNFAGPAGGSVSLPAFTNTPCKACLESAANGASPFAAKGA